MPVIVADGRTANFTDVGSGEAVLLLHSSSSSGARWRSMSEALRDRYRVLAADLLGYGGSTPWDCRQPLRTEDELVLLRAVIAHVGAPVHVVGHSYGGLLALRLALADQPLLRSLVLIEPIAFWLLRQAGEHALHAEMRSVAETFIAAFDRGDPEAAAAPYIEYWHGPGAWAELPTAVRSYVIATAGKTRWEWATGFDVDIPLTDMARLQLPTRILCGDRTNATTRRITELLHGAIPGSDYVLIPGGRHMSPITHPDPVNAAIEAHLMRVSEGTRASAPR
jgi:pimeloyl-ACP methyl ester carboxylesterase